MTSGALNANGKEMPGKKMRPSVRAGDPSKRSVEDLRKGSLLMGPRKSKMLRL